MKEGINTERNTFKELLRTIKDNKYEMPEGCKPFELALEMVNYLGDMDDELRDDLSHSVLANWIINGTLNTQEIREILNISLDEKHMLYELGGADDTVFTRTFNVLTVAAAVYKHRNEGYLSKEEISSVLDKVIRFYSEDKDVRGYIKGKGWAHGAAHGADALDELARCEEIGYDSQKRILDAIHKKISIGYYSYVHEEDERMMTAIAAVLERKQVPESEILEWIRSFEKINETGQYPHDMIIRINIKNFLRSLYFRLINHQEYVDIINEAKNVLEKINRF